MGNTALLKVTTAPTMILSASSDTITVRTLSLSNVSEISSQIDVEFRRDGVSYSIFDAHGIPGKKTVSVFLSKDLDFYLESGDSLWIAASHNDRVEAMVAYEGSYDPSSSSSSSGSSSSSSCDFLEALSEACSGQLWGPLYITCVISEELCLVDCIQVPGCMDCQENENCPDGHPWWDVSYDPGYCYVELEACRDSICPNLQDFYQGCSGFGDGSSSSDGGSSSSEGGVPIGSSSLSSDSSSSSGCNPCSALQTQDPSTCLCACDPPGDPSLTVAERGEAWCKSNFDYPETWNPGIAFDVVNCSCNERPTIPICESCSGATCVEVPLTFFKDLTPAERDSLLESYTCADYGYYALRSNCGSNDPNASGC